MKSAIAMWELLLEAVSLLTEASTPAEQAHDLGLHHVGYGYWANEHDEVVARTVDGKLVKLDPLAGKTDFKSAQSKGGEDTHGKELIVQGQEALKKLALHAFEHLGSEEKPGLLVGMQADIAKTIMNGTPPGSSVTYAALGEQAEDYLAFLKAVAAMKGSKLFKAVKSYEMWKKTQESQDEQDKYYPTPKEAKTAMQLLEPLVQATKPKDFPILQQWVLDELEKSKERAALGEQWPGPWLKDCKDLVDQLGVPQPIHHIKLLRAAITAVAQGKDELGSEWSDFAKTQMPKPGDNDNVEVNTSPVSFQKISQAEKFTKPLLDKLTGQNKTTLDKFIIHQLQKFQYASENHLNYVVGLKDAKDVLESVGLLTIQNIMGLRKCIEAAFKGVNPDIATLSNFGLTPQEANDEMAGIYNPTPIGPPALDPATSSPGVPDLSKEPDAPPPQVIKNPIDPIQAAKVIGYNDKNQTKWEIFTKLMKKAEDAETTAQLNYIRALAKKAGILGATDDEQWNNWKKLLKYIKSTKDNLIQGAKEKGKIKAKLKNPNDAPPMPQTKAAIDALAKKLAAKKAYVTTIDPKIGQIPVVPPVKNDPDSVNKIKTLTDPNYQDVVPPSVSNPQIKTLKEPDVQTPDFNTKAAAFDDLFNKFTSPLKKDGPAPMQLAPNAGQPLLTPDEYQAKHSPQVQEKTAETLASVLYNSGMDEGDFTPKEYSKITHTIADILSGGLEIDVGIAQLYNSGIINNYEAKGLEKHLGLLLDKPVQPVKQVNYDDDGHVLPDDEYSTLKPVSLKDVEEIYSQLGWELDDFSPKQNNDIATAISNVLSGQFGIKDAIKNLQVDGVLNPHTATQLKQQLGALLMWQNEPHSLTDPESPAYDPSTSVDYNPINSLNYPAVTEIPDAVKDVLTTAGIDTANFHPQTAQLYSAAIIDILNGTKDSEALDELEAEGVITSDEKQALYKAIIEKTNPTKIAAPAGPDWKAGKKSLDSFYISPKSAKAVDTSMNGWAKGDKDKLINWIAKKYKEDPKQGWQQSAMALVKNYDFPLDKVPQELLPDTVKDATNPAQAAIEDTANDLYVNITDDFEGLGINLTMPQHSAIAAYVKDALATGKLAPGANELGNALAPQLVDKVVQAVADHMNATNKNPVTPQPAQPVASKAAQDSVEQSYNDFMDHATPGALTDDMETAVGAYFQHIIDNMALPSPEMLSGAGFNDSEINHIMAKGQAALEKATALASPQPDPATSTAFKTFTPQEFKNQEIADQLVGHMGGAQLLGTDAAKTVDHYVKNALDAGLPLTQVAQQELIKLLGTGKAMLLADLVLDALDKQAIAASKAKAATPPPPVAAPKPTVVVDPYEAPDKIFDTDFGLLIQGKLTKYEKSQLNAAIIKAVQKSSVEPITSLYGTNDLDSKEIETIANAVKAYMSGQLPDTPKTAGTSAAPAPTPVPAAVVPNEKATPEEAAQFVKDFMSGIGVDIKGLPATAVTDMAKATMKALSANTEFGVHYPFKKLKDSGAIPADYIDALKYEIVEKLEAEGKLDPTEGAFKKYLDPTDAVDTFLKGVPQFTATLSPADKQKIIDTATKGLQFVDTPGSSGYQQAKALYNKELVGKIPGFDETVFQKFRNQLMQYHDELKQAEAFEKEQKFKQAQKKKEAAEVAKALSMLQSGDLNQKIDGILGMVGVGFSPNDKQVAKLTIAKALQAPSSQDMFDIIDNLAGKNPLGKFDPYGTGGSSSSSSKTIPIDGVKFDMLKNLVAATYFDKLENVPDDVVEPKVKDTPEERAVHVFDRWAKEFGSSVGTVPSHNNERTNLQKAVIAALAEPNPKKVNAMLNAALATGTSLSDKQIKQLRDLVHSERRQPASLTGKTISKPAKHSPVAGSSSGNAATSLMNDPTFNSKLKYYGISPMNQKQIHDIMLNGLTSKVTTGNKASKATHLAYSLKAHGVPVDKAKNMANWITLQAIKGSEIAQKAHAVEVAKQAAASGGVLSANPDIQAKQKVAAMSSQQDPHETARVEWVKGEKLIVKSGRTWTKTDDGDSAGCHKEAVAQVAWRKANLKPEDYAKFTAAANGWQGSGQWTKNAEIRKATNYIMTKTIEGPPPQMTKVAKYVERGMSLKIDEFKQFIQAFELGKKVYLGPSGFSAGHTHPSSYSHASTDTVGVLLRVYPSKKTGMMKAARINGRPENGDGYASEKELVVGTNDNTRVVNVIKHVDTSGPKVEVSYEIELQYEDGVNESVLTEAPIHNAGFSLQYWKHLNPATVKMMIKYLNTPVRLAP